MINKKLEDALSSFLRKINNEYRKWQGALLTLMKLALM